MELLVYDTILEREARRYLSRKTPTFGFAEPDEGIFDQTKLGSFPMPTPLDIASSERPIFGIDFFKFLVDYVLESEKVFRPIMNEHFLGFVSLDDSLSVRFWTYYDNRGDLSSLNDPFRYTYSLSQGYTTVGFSPYEWSSKHSSILRRSEIEECLGPLKTDLQDYYISWLEKKMTNGKK